MNPSHLDVRRITVFKETDAIELGDPSTKIIIESGRS
jgi:hypothetical protein